MFMLTYIDAIEKIFSSLPELDTKRRKLSEANGYFLAEEIVSPLDLPAFDNSAMDGFALRSVDAKQASNESPVRLRVTGESLAGHQFDKKLKQGECAYITTGAVIPKGADAVIAVEKIENNPEDEVLINEPVKKYNHIRFAGEEMRAGDAVFETGTKLTPGHLGMLATFGIINPLVYQKPTVGFIATGDELIDPGEIPEPGQIRNSNTSLIKAMVEDLGCSFYDMGIARDSQKDLISGIKVDSLPDVLITSAGVSMGKYDLVMQTLEQLGLKVIFWKVAIKPGKPLVFGSMGKTLFFGVPGNPVSGAVVFRQFIEPALIAMSGGQLRFRTVIAAKSLDSFKATRGRLNFARGSAFYADNWQVRSAGKQGSHMMSGLANSNCLIIIPPDTKVERGDEVYIQLSEGPHITWTEFRKYFV